MLGLIRRYTRWLHTGWPAGAVEKLPHVREDGSTNVPGIYVVGDLTGIPLLKFSLDSGARAVRTLAQGLRPRGAPTKGPKSKEKVHDLVIIGAGVSGMSAALEARRRDLDFVLLEATEPFSTIVNFPRKKPIYTYPTEMRPYGELQVSATEKETLLEELRAQTVQQGIAPRLAHCSAVRRERGLLRVILSEQQDLLAHRVIVAIGRSGNFRRLDVPGEENEKVSNRLHDPRDFNGSRVLVVGGGDSALETAVALDEARAEVTLSYRRKLFSRPKPENVQSLEQSGVDVVLGSTVERIDHQSVRLRDEDGVRELPNDVVFTMLGREAPLDFFRRSGLHVQGDWGSTKWFGLATILALAVFVYHWKTSAGIPVYDWFEKREWFPFNLGIPADPSTLVGTIRLSVLSPSFYYSLAYSLAVVIFGIARVRRRRTPYVRVQTWTLMLIQVLPLFLLPYVLLPWAGHNGWFDHGVGRAFADALFPITEWDQQGREYWRSVGLILAWPLMVWNAFTHEPLIWWLVIGFAQTFVLIPLLIRFWGKGAYCGWICSCGALAETVGDTHRHKMPHGPGFNRLNMLGQGVLGAAFLLLILRVAAWIATDGSWLDRFATAAYMGGHLGKSADWGQLSSPWNFLNYNWAVDVTMAGILGVGLYFHFSGRMWCRFGCPLAALMHIYTRFSRFRILSDKQKCISCNACTSVCHQGIDVMSFANRGEPMADVQCVRCSACVLSCPTGVLQFGQIDPRSGRVLRRDHLPASPVLMREKRA
jgi:thioredoxin reductase/polyferredoxin